MEASAQDRCLPELSQLRESLSNSDAADLKRFCSSRHLEIVADLLAMLSPGEAWNILLLLEKQLRAELFSHLDEDMQMRIGKKRDPQVLAEIVAEMPHDDRVDFLKRLPAKRRNAILPILAQAERDDIYALTAHEEGAAGAIMTTEYATLTPGLTAKDAITTLRHEAPDKETIYYCYIVAPDRRLLGFTSLKDLILADPKSVVGDLMHKASIFCWVDDDQEDAARKIAKYDLLALPVLDRDDRLVGIITYDDALDVIQDENTEDVERFMGISGAHEAGSYMGTSPWGHFKKRIGWLLGLAAMGIASGMILHHYENLLDSLVLLAIYIPMMTDSGGNAGSQSASMIIRALALGEIGPRDFWRVFSKELMTALLLALVLGAFGFAKVYFMSQGSTVPDGMSLSMIAICIAVALTIQIMSSTLFGAILPMAATVLRLDPAAVASPAITTVVDISGMLIYFGSVKLILGL